MNFANIRNFIKTNKYMILLFSMLAVSIVCIIASAYNFYNGYIFGNDSTPIPANTPGDGKAANSYFANLVPKAKNTSFPAGMSDEFMPLYAYNSDTVGWIKVPGTSIDTVILKSKDNEHYLRNNFYGKYTRYGNPFLDYKNNSEFFMRNNVLYGHTTYDDTQAFASLVNYISIDFYKRYPIIEYSSLYGSYKWKIFAVFYSTAEKKSDNGYVFLFNRTDITDAKFNGYIEQINQRALYTTGVSVDRSDKILTMSTCSYVYGKKVSTRLVVVARLLREGESTVVDSTKIKDHPDYRRPQIWYDSYGKSNPYKNSTW